MLELPSKLDLLCLYGRFIERKYEIYQGEKLQVSVSNAAAIEQREYQLKRKKSDHQLLALKVLFTEEQVALFENNKECSFSAEQLTRIGIVQVSDDGKPHFIHRTFAEYYVADYLVNGLTKGNNTSEQVLDFILKDVFQKEQHQVIRAFIDGLLSRSKISKQMLKQHGKGIHDLGKCAVQILNRAVEEGNVNIVAMLLDSLQASQHTDSLRQLLLPRDNGGNSVYFMATERGNIQVLEKLWECANEELTTEEINNKLLLATDNEGMTVWHRAAYMGKLDILLQVWEWAEEKLTREDINSKLLLATDNEGMTALHEVACDGNLDVLLKIWEWINEKLTTEKINNKLLLATDNEGRTALHEAACEGKLVGLRKIWEWARGEVTTEDVDKK
jgi:ankyrin repeat protein